MVDNAHLKILNDGVPAWNEWRKKNPEILPDLSKTNLRGAGLGCANFKGVNLGEANLTDANLKYSNLTNADLSGASLDGANLEKADLTDSRLLGVWVNDTTIFADAVVDGCKIDIYTLERLKNYGGLSKLARTTMKIRDDLGDLRASFSGAYRWVHIIALAIFLFPYVSFATMRYFEAEFSAHDSGASIALWEAIARYLWNGGQDWQSGWNFHWSFVTFLLLAAYNLARFLLLSKTLKMEHQQEISGLPVRFFISEEPFWHHLKRFLSLAFWAGLIILALNTWHFLTQQVPIDA